MNWHCDICEKKVPDNEVRCNACNEAMDGIGATARKLTEHLLTRIENLEKRVSSLIGVTLLA